MSDWICLSFAEASSDDEEELSPYAQNNVSFEDIGLGRSLRNTLAKANILRPSRIQSKCLLSLTYPNLHPPAIIQVGTSQNGVIVSHTTCYHWQQAGANLPSEMIWSYWKPYAWR